MTLQDKFSLTHICFYPWEEGGLLGWTDATCEIPLNPNFAVVSCTPKSMNILIPHRLRAQASAIRKKFETSSFFRRGPTIQDFRSP